MHVTAVDPSGMPRAAAWRRKAASGAEGKDVEGAAVARLSATLIFVSSAVAIVAHAAGSNSRERKSPPGRRRTRASIDHGAEPSPTQELKIDAVLLAAAPAPLHAPAPAHSPSKWLSSPLPLPPFPSPDASAALGIIHRKGLGRTQHIDTGLIVDTTGCC